MSYEKGWELYFNNLRCKHSSEFLLRSIAWYMVIIYCPSLPLNKPEVIGSWIKPVLRWDAQLLNYKARHILKWAGIRYWATTFLLYCKVWNINVELLLATLASGSDSLILRSAYICSIFPRFFVNIMNIWRHACDDFDPFNIVFLSK